MWHPVGMDGTRFCGCISSVFYISAYCGTPAGLALGFCFMESKQYNSKNWIPAGGVVSYNQTRHVILSYGMPHSRVSMIEGTIYKKP